MATLLYRLGRFSFRNAWKVIGVWILLLAGILGASVALGGQMQESFAIPGTQSQNALDRLEAVFPQVAGASAEAVTVVPEGASVNDPKYTDAINRMAAAIEKIDGVDSVVTPFSQYAGKAITADHSMAITRVQFEGPSTEVKPRTLTELKDTASIGEDAGLRVEFGGQVFQDRTFGITTTEIFGVLFAGIVLLVTFGALLPAGLPLLSALIGVGVVMGGIISVSAFTTVSSTAPLLALMIGLAVGIDYSLFILSRHRTRSRSGRGTPGVGGDRRRHGGKRRGVRRHHGHHRPARPARCRHPVPQRDGGRRRLRRSRGDRGRDHPAAGAARPGGRPTGAETRFPRPPARAGHRRRRQAQHGAALGAPAS